MQTNHTHRLPNAAVLSSMSITDLMETALRLSDLLAEESVMLDEMRFKDLASTQDEKAMLTKTLEIYQQTFAANPDFIRSADEKTREELLLLTDDLAYSVEENFRRTAVARAINERIMQAIRDVLSEQHRPSTYGAHGQTAQSHDLALSMNLNQQA